MKKVWCLILLVIISICLSTNVFAESAKTGVLIGDVHCVKRAIQGDDVIKIIRVDDPENPFVSIYFTTIKSGQFFAMADPSNTSIMVRLTGKIPVDENGRRIVNTSNNPNIASVSKSIGSKVMKIARFYDKKKDTLVYVIYTTKWLDGSLKHNISGVPLGHPLTP